MRDRGTSRVALEDLRADDRGLSFRLSGGADAPVDVTFDGRRVWSFWTLRDTRSQGGRQVATWPSALVPFLDGRTRVGVVDHVHEHQLAEVDVALGSGEERIAVVDRAGRPLALDKSLTLTRIFASRDAEQVAPLLDAVDMVVAALRDAGVDPFLAYGSLLGAVRSGRLIGHDSDVDLGYVSRHEHPVDVVAESFRLQRALVERGLFVVRYSGLAFRVNVRESDGAARGLDVFGGFLRDGRLYLMGEVGAPFQRAWIHPLSTATLEGRTFPSPAVPERLLEAMYGPGWRVPDPAYKFTTARATVRRLDGWFRGTRGGRNLSWPLPPARALRREPLQPSAMARWVLDQEPARGGLLVDAGCGAGVDAFVAAQQGWRAAGLDFRPSSYRLLAARARREAVAATYGWANFNELRSALCSGAELAREPGPRVVLARHLVDTLDASGREGFWRWARMVAGRSGRVYVQVLARGAGAVGNSRPLAGAVLEREAAARGGTVLSRTGLVEHPRDAPQGGAGRHGQGSGHGRQQAWPVTRLVVSWDG